VKPGRISSWRFFKKSQIENSLSARWGFFYILIHRITMLSQAIGREGHQQTKKFEQFLIYEDKINKELIQKGCAEEIVQEFLVKLKSTYTKGEDLIKILEEAKSQTNLN